MGFEDSSNERSGGGGFIRQLILGVVLLLVAAGAVYDFGFLQRKVHEEHQKLADVPADLKSDEEIHKIMDREPTSVKDYENGARVETYSWQRPIPFMTFDVYAIYRKIETQTPEGETIETHYRFVKATRTLENEKLPASEEVPGGPPVAPGMRGAGFGGGGGGGGNQDDDDSGDDGDDGDSDDDKDSGENNEAGDAKENKEGGDGEEGEDKNEGGGEKAAGDGKESESEKKDDQGAGKESGESTEKKETENSEKKDGENKESDG